MRRLPLPSLPLLLLFSLLLAPPTVLAQPEGVESTRSLTYFDALVLGVVEGVTEFLPVSSTGHLVLVNQWLGLNSAAPALDRQGQLIYPVARGDGLPPEPLTIKALADGYAIVIQIGAIAAVLLIYWERVVTMLLGVLGRSREGLLLARNLFVAFSPAVVVGLLLEDWIDRHLFHSLAVVAALFAGGLLILAVEAWRRKKRVVDEGPDLHQLSVKQCFTVGLLQCVAMWPGTSRSMMTIIGGYLAGLSPLRAAEFSFLLGLITLSAASIYKGLKAGPELLAVFSLGPLVLGGVVAALSAALAVKWMVSYLGRNGLGVFAWYRMGLALTLLWII
jgi:undecaprenyl-diphosphatase